MLNFRAIKPVSGAKFLQGLKPKLLLLPLSIGLLVAFQPAQAEDPLLGRIKAIKCVGCEVGKVTLVIHDPIEVRDYDITITDLDYGKIISPLPGKMVYEGANSCFYWNDVPKVEKAEKAEKKAPVMAKKVSFVDTLRSDSAGTTGTTVTTGTTTPTLPTEVKPSKCIPYQKAAIPKASKTD